jgi:hypothetical protein
VVAHPADVARAGAEAVGHAALPQPLRVTTVGLAFVRAADRVRPVPEAALGAGAPPAGGGTS